jgi:hypothetical protein
VEFAMMRRGLIVAFLFIALLPRVALAAGVEPLKIISQNGEHAFMVEMAVNDDERARGLMFRKEVPEGKGMLFDFQTEQHVAFWMKNTYVSLDMIFIRANGVILSIAENTPVLSLEPIPSGGPVRGVLEVAAGTAKKLGIKPGDHVVQRIFNGK